MKKRSRVAKREQMAKKRWRKNMVIAIVTIVIVAAGFGYLLTQPPAANGQQSGIVVKTTSLESSVSTRTVAPDFTLVSIDGKVFRLSDFQGKAVILEFMSTTCPHCINEMAQLATVHQRFGDSVVIISISINPSDDDASIRAFAAKYNAQWYWAKDTTGMSALYGASGVPMLVTIDPNGRVITVNTGETSAEILAQQIGSA